jgi:hypothetical protein
MDLNNASKSSGHRFYLQMILNVVYQHRDHAQQQNVQTLSLIPLSIKKYCLTRINKL